jgi:LysM repeat protein
VVTATPEDDGSTPPDSGEIYVVQRGDTLFHIAQRFNTSISAIAQLNGIVNVDRIQVGQRLKIPGSPPRPNPTPPPSPQIYLVLPGDTLSRISLRFGVPISRIARANNIVNWNWIFAGQRLIIP